MFVALELRVVTIYDGGNSLQHVVIFQLSVLNVCIRLIRISYKMGIFKANFRHRPLYTGMNAVFVAHAQTTVISTFLPSSKNRVLY